MGIVQLCSPKAISDIWLESLLFRGGAGSIWKINYSRYTKFLVVAHMDFLVAGYKNESQDL